MKNFVAVVLAILTVFYPSLPLMGAEPTCVLGGPTAMDTNRQLAEGETFVKTDRPLVVNLRFRPTKARPEQVGECMLPSRSEVAVDKNGILLWVKECGNDEVNRNIFVTPFTPLRGLPGPVGPMGPQGPAGLDGRDGRDYTPLPVGEGMVTKRPNRTWMYVVGGILVAGGIAALCSGGGKKSGTPPGGSTGPAF
ncbi:MAG: hypothetical protein WA060_00990 [Minisyncoccia bacterium]